ncbi:MAG: IucA/IucC family C-terminal-domain containing protein, partial [Candidatus Dormibacteraceae bacterium]
MTDYSPADPFAPLIDLLTKIRSSGREVNIHPELHLPPTENSGWLTAAQLADPAQPWLGEMVERTAVNLGTTRQIAASLAWKRYSYWVIFLVVIGWTLNRRVPLLDAQHLCVRFSQQAEYPEVAVVDGVAAVLPDDSLAGPSSIVVVESPAALLSLARQHLIERHLAAVAAALHRLTGVSERLLWCTVAAAMVQPLLL